MPLVKTDAVQMTRYPGRLEWAVDCRRESWHWLYGEVPGDDLVESWNGK
jgi:hypothetical protein